MNATPEFIESTVAEIFSREGIAYKAEFVPKSQAPRKDWEEKDKKEIPRACWKITLSKGMRSFETYWWAGWGHYFVARWGKSAYWKEFRKKKEALSFVKEHLPKAYLIGTPINWEKDEEDVMSAYGQCPLALRQDR